MTFTTYRFPKYSLSPQNHRNDTQTLIWVPNLWIDMLDVHDNYDTMSATSKTTMANASNSSSYAWSVKNEVVHPLWYAPRDIGSMWYLTRMDLKILWIYYLSYGKFSFQNLWQGLLHISVKTKRPRLITTVCYYHLHSNFWPMESKPQVEQR